MPSFKELNAAGRERTRIAFVIPPSEAAQFKFVSYQQPINLAYLASSARSAGAEPAIWDYGIGPFEEEAFLHKVKEFNPRIIGIHCKTFNIAQGDYIAGIVKKHLPDIMTIVGGPHSSALPKETLDEFKNFDLVVIGEGDITISEICKNAAANRPVDEIPGLAMRKNSVSAVNAPRGLVKEIDALAYPARDLFSRQLYGRSHCTRGLPYSGLTATEIFTSRGCPGKCIFCAVNVSYGNCVRFRSAGNCLGEIEECLNRYKYSHIIIQDDAFTLKKQRVYEFLEGFRRLGLRSWSCDTRVDTVDADLLKEMAASGCKKVSFGVESGSERILGLIKKNITPAQVRRAVAWAKSAGIKIVECTFIVGSHPDETYEDVELSRRLIKDLMPDVLSVSSIVPYPGTEVYTLIKEAGYLAGSRWSDFQMIGTKLSWRTRNFSSSEISRLQMMLLNRYYFSPGYIINRLKKINSAGDLKYWAKAGFDFLKFFAKPHGRPFPDGSKGTFNR